MAEHYLREIVKKYPDCIPFSEAAKFLYTSEEELWAECLKGKCPFKQVLAGTGNLGVVIPTRKFVLWMTLGDTYMLAIDGREEIIKMKPKVAQMKRLVKAYHTGSITEAEIAEIERINGMGIEELVAKIKEALFIVSHKLNLMTITEVKKWSKEEHTLSEEEKEAYASVNKCTYEEFAEAAHVLLGLHEQRKAQTRERRLVKQREEERAWLQKLVEEGKATTEDGKSFVVPDENTVYILT